MSETFISTAQPRPKASRLGPADKRVFAQVEKWLAMIREIVREQIQA